MVTRTMTRICGHPRMWHELKVRILILAQLWISCCGNGRNQPMRKSDLLSRATREIRAQWELLELREGVLYLRSPERTPSAKNRMVLPQKLVKESLTEINDGLAGVHLGRMKTLTKMKTWFWRPGLTKEAHRYCSSCLT